MKKKYNILLVLALLLIFPTDSYASFVRQNNFLNETNSAEKVAQIKKFQALNNLVADGSFGNMTKAVLYNQEYVAQDIITAAPTKDYWIVVNTTTRTLTLYKGDAVVHKYAVAVGAKSTPTPNVKGTVSSKAVNPAWGGMYGKYKPTSANDPKNPLGERWMGLNLGTKYRGYGIHGTILPGQIGKSVSNGCIRMFNYDIEKELFPIVKIGTPVWLGDAQTLASWGVTQRNVKEVVVAEEPAKAPVDDVTVPSDSVVDSNDDNETAPSTSTVTTPVDREELINSDVEDGVETVPFGNIAY